MKKEYQEYYHQELAGIVPCTDEELKTLLKKLPDAAAKERLIEGSLHLAAALSEEFEGRGADLFDLIQEGNIGLAVLMNSLTTPVEVSEFIELRLRAIRASMEAYCKEHEELQQGKERFSAYVNVLNTVITRMSEELGREPSAEEIADKMQISVDEVHMLTKSALNAVMLDREAAAEAFER